MSQVVTVDDLLQELEQMVKNAMKLPLSGGRVVLDGQNVEDILMDIRDAMPQECRQARAIVADRSKIPSGRRSRLSAWPRRRPAPWSARTRLSSRPSRRPTT